MPSDLHREIQGRVDAALRALDDGDIDKTDRLMREIIALCKQLPEADQCRLMDATRAMAMYGRLN